MVRSSWRALDRDRIKAYHEMPVLDEDLCAHFRHRRGDGHCYGVRVRHQLGDLSRLRWRRFWERAGGEGIFAFSWNRVSSPSSFFGWNKVGRKCTFSPCMVCLGSTLVPSGLTVANSCSKPRPATTSSARGCMPARKSPIFGMVFSPSSMDRLSHAVMGAWQPGVLCHQRERLLFASRRHFGFLATFDEVGLCLALAARCCNW